MAKNNQQLNTTEIGIVPEQQIAPESKTILNVISTSKLARDKTVDNLRRLNEINQKLI